MVGSNFVLILLFTSKVTDSNSTIVNELSGTIDLESTLIRAEALFRKFQRLIEAIDKKPNFPAPRFSLNTVAPSLLAPLSPKNNNPSAPNGGASSSSNSNDNDNNNSQQGQKGKQPEPPKSPGGELKKVITPELRSLLSKQVEILPRKEVAKQGDGFLARAGSGAAK